jgi:HAMP domain-containing protein
MDDLAAAARPVIEALDGLAATANKVAQGCAIAEPVIGAGALDSFIGSCSVNRAAIEKACTDSDAIIEAAEALNGVESGVPSEAQHVIAAFKMHVDSLPELSREEAAKEFLIVAEEKYARCRTAKREVEAADKRAETTAKILDEYGKVSTAVLRCDTFFGFNSGTNFPRSRSCSA